MASGYDIPDNAPLVDENRHITLSWLSVFNRWRMVTQAQQQSGPTANRPTKKLWIGRVYFDTDLGVDGIGKPVWVAEIGPPAVWVDGTGNTV